VIQILTALASHTLALVLYPGLLTVALFGGVAEVLWTRLTEGAWPERPRRRPTALTSTVGLCSILAAVQLAAPFNPMPAEERNVVIAAVALAITVWAGLALTIESVARPGLLLVVQLCWVLAVLGPAVQPESLRPQALGNVLVPALVPLKIASGFLYLLALPALLRLVPFAPEPERRKSVRLDVARALSWFPYCGLFTTLFFLPSGDDGLGLLRFFGITALVAAIVLLAGLLIRGRGSEATRGFYARAVAPYAGLVVVLVVVTSILER
jgi:hypothetical protein